jgi:hypothetical protein
MEQKKKIEVSAGKFSLYSNKNICNEDKTFLSIGCKLMEAKTKLLLLN